MSALLVIWLAVGAVAEAPDATGALADAVAAQVAGAELPVGLEVSAPSASLARAVSAAVSSRVATVRVEPARTLEESERLARAQGARSLLRLDVTLEQGALVARGTVSSTWVNFWAGRMPLRSQGRAVAVSVPADEAARLLASAPADRVAGDGVLTCGDAPWATFERPLAALGAADVNGDGVAEIIAVLLDEVKVLDGAGVELASASLAMLERSATPSRDPFGRVAVSGTRVTVFSARFATGAVLVFDAKTRALRIEASRETAGFVPGEARFAPDVVAVSDVGSARLTVSSDGRGALSGGRTFKGLGAGSALLERDGGVDVMTTSAAVTPVRESLRWISGRDGSVRGEVPLVTGPARTVVAVKSRIFVGGARVVERCDLGGGQ